MLSGASKVGRRDRGHAKNPVFSQFLLSDGTPLITSKSVCQQPVSRVNAIGHGQVPGDAPQRCQRTHLRLSRRHHGLLRARGDCQWPAPRGAGSVPQPVGQAQPRYAVRVLAVHARPAQEVIYFARAASNLVEAERCDNMHSHAVERTRSARRSPRRWAVHDHSLLSWYLLLLERHQRWGLSRPPQRRF